MKYTVESVKQLLTCDSSAESISKAFEEFNRDYSTVPDTSKFHIYRENEVIDEDKSVKWNREEVKRLNEEYQAECERLSKEYNEIKSLLINAIINDLREDYELSVAECTLIWNWAYSEERSSGIYYVVNKFRDIAEMYEDLLSVRGS